MSYWTRTSIECDVCNYIIDYDDTDVNDAQARWTDSDYHRRDVEVGSTYYDHMCEECFHDEFLYCGRCDELIHRDDGYYCDESFCADCVEEAHTDWREKLPRGFIGDECNECGYKIQGQLDEIQVGKPTITL